MFLELARRNLERAKIRSALAILGIMIGVIAISAIGIFGESLKSAVMENFMDLANEIFVTPSYQKGYKYIDEKDVERLERLPAEKVVAIKAETLLVETKDRKTYVSVYGMENVEDLFKLSKGDSRECVAGSSLARDLNLRAGSKILVEGKECKVSGILEKVEMRFGISPDFAIIMPEDLFSKISNAGYSQVIIKTKTIEDVEKIESEIQKRINFKEERLNVFKAKAILETISSAFNQINLFLMAIASISLLVAGVSILNIMLMSTIERTKEIGIMRAIGAKRGDVLRIFLMEALVLGLIGSFLGGFLSILAGYGITMLIIGSAKHVFQPMTLIYLALGFFVGTATAVLSGLYPAWRASRLEPVEALRYE